ncbi:deoxynucleoside monophosphate kinase [Microbacterium phage Cen1621]|uniref:Deoxynucleoside monophosphate kinase n=1 Tax=Microbacterium phage Cen1621 TaxID=2965191 RepID=A0A9E7QB17_9CAUD|nr:deoxynucleoside monophosphate kinase [Microbacterium phage Cen1621]
MTYLDTSLPLIGIVGRKRSGKSTITDELARHGYDAVAYADPLRDFLGASDPIVGYELVGPYKVREVHWSEAMECLGYELAKDRYPEVRRIMQTTGTEGMRQTLGQKYGLEKLLKGVSPWVAMAELRIDEALSHVKVSPGKPERFVYKRLLAFNDVRFPNEADLIRRKGGILIRVIRPGLPTDDAHESETALDHYATDYELVNDGSIAELHSAVAAIVEGYR